MLEQDIVQQEHDEESINCWCHPKVECGECPEGSICSQLDHILIIIHKESN